MMKRSINNQQVGIIAVILTLIIAFLSIGWSAFNSTMTLSNYAYVRIPYEVRVTDFVLDNVSNGGLGTFEDFGVDYITANASLPNANSTITYKVEITNMQVENGSYVGIYSANGLPEGLEIKAWTDYNLKDKICDDVDPTDCGSGAQKTFYITIGYKNSSSYDSNNTDFVFDINFDFREFHKITYNDIVGNYPTEVIDGDDLVITLDNVSADELFIEGAIEYIINIDYTYNNSLLTIPNVSEDLVVSKLQSFIIVYNANGGYFDNNTSVTTNTVRYMWKNNQNVILTGTYKIPTNSNGASLYGWYTDDTTFTTEFDPSIRITQSQNVYARWSDKTAEVNGVFFDSLQEAIDAVPTDGTLTVVTLLKNTTEGLTISEGQNIAFNLQNFSVTAPSDPNNIAVIENNGTIQISNGTIKTASTSTVAAINNNAKGTITITGGEIISTGTKQALYNNGGVVNIGGNASFSNTSSNRAAVQNNSGSMTITGGTIVSTNYYGLDNKGSSLIIGTKDGNSAPDSLLIQGKTYGVNSTKIFKYYDGTIKGTTRAISDVSKINDLETNCFIAYTSEVIGGKTYQVAYLDLGVTVTFDPNNGTVTEGTRSVQKGQAIGTLPGATRKLYIFDGWFTERNGGTQITSSTIINDDVTYYAHWSQKIVAEINGTSYYSLQSAVDATPTNGTQTTIKLLEDISENITIYQNRNVVIDLQNHTIASAVSNPVITNNGTLEITGGTINQTKAYAAINNETTGILVILDVNVSSTGGRAAVYNLGAGNVTISGNTNLSSNASGEFSISGVTINRATIMNINNNGSITVTGGTIVGNNGLAISNNGVLVLGTMDGTINTSIPMIKGETYGVKNYNIFRYYDGIIKGRTGTIDGVITEQEANTELVSGTETIDGKTYQTSHIEHTS